MTLNSFLSIEELQNLGLRAFGENVLISRYAQFYSPSEISIGNNVRIDDFCILSGKISIGDYIHISAYVALYGNAGIEIHDYAGISAKSILYSEIDDFSGESLIGPWHQDSQRQIFKGKVVLGKYAQIGCSSVIFPDIMIGEGAVVGAMSLVKKNLSPWTINAGIPAKFIKNRSKDLLNLL